MEDKNRDLFVGCDMKGISHDRAAYIYDSLYNIIVNENYYNVNDRRDSTTWNVSAMFQKGEYAGGIGVDSLSMEKRDNGYIMTATYYVWR